MDLDWVFLFLLGEINREMRRYYSNIGTHDPIEIYIAQMSAVESVNMSCHQLPKEK